MTSNFISKIMKTSTLAVLLFVVSFASAKTAFAGYAYTFIFPSSVASSSSPSPAPTPTGGGLYSLGGCKDPNAKNYDSWVTYDTGTCVYDKKPTTPPVVVPTGPCVPYFTHYERQGNSGPEVLKIKKFLNEKEGEKLVLDDKYNFSLTKAVMRFQLKYEAKVLTPWNLILPTGRWYQSTQKKANDILGCSSSVRLDNGVTID